MTGPGGGTARPSGQAKGIPDIMGHGPASPKRGAAGAPLLLKLGERPGLDGNREMGPCPPPRPHRTSGPGCPPDAAPSAGHGTGPRLPRSLLRRRRRLSLQGRVPVHAAGAGGARGAQTTATRPARPRSPHVASPGGPAGPQRPPGPRYLAPRSWGLPPWTNAAAAADEPWMPAAHSSPAGVLRGSPRFANCYRSHRQPLRRGSRTGRPGRGARSLARPPPGPAPRTPARARSLAPRRQAPPHARPDHGAPKNVHWLPYLQVPPPPRVHWRPAAGPRPTHTAPARAHWHTRRRTPPQAHHDSRRPEERSLVPPPPGPAPRRALIGAPPSGPAPQPRLGTHSLAPPRQALPYTSPAPIARSLALPQPGPAPSIVPALAHWRPRPTQAPPPTRVHWRSCYKIPPQPALIGVLAGMPRPRRPDALAHWSTSGALPS